jgi:hypothetical protein
MAEKINQTVPSAGRVEDKEFPMLELAFQRNQLYGQHRFSACGEGVGWRKFAGSASQLVFTIHKVDI